MNILAINTTNNLAEVSFKNQDITISKSIQSPYSENIMKVVQDVLGEVNKNLSEIDTLGIVTGPGSFTGIRIGMAVIKGLSFGANIPCVSINSFDLISYNIQDSEYIALLDSGNADCYYAIVKNKTVQEMGFATIETLLSFAEQKSLKIYFASQEQSKFNGYEGLNEVKISENTLSQIIYQKAQNSEFTDLEKLSPIYIKLSQAEIGLEQKMKENLTFEVATKNDVNALAVVDSQCFDGGEKYSIKSFEDELNEVSKHYIVAKYAGLVIGYVGLQTLGDELNLLKIAVLPQYRNLGVGFKLMQLSFDYKSKNNLKNYFLEVRESNSQAIKLYKKFGFKLQSKREKYYSNGETALVMNTK